ncbi:MAG TPA: hypothetical protein VJ754_00620 [Anaerolineae bacterium]|nr:hypothetical protein [Anaerolineae bacterium]
MEPLLLLGLWLLFLSMLTSGSTQGPTPAVVVMASPPERSGSIAGEVFLLVLLAILYLLGTTSR